jgi:flagellar hook assembly protein FlgD
MNFSDPVTVRFGNPNGLELLGSFPNPARSRATVRFAIPEQMSADNVRLELYDLLGRQVKTIPAAEASGRVEQTLDVSNLPSGTYLLRLSAGGQTQTQQVTIVR